MADLGKPFAVEPQAVGVDPSHNLHTPENRPVAILDEGTAIGELFS